MVQLKTPKPNIMDRLRAKNKANGVIARKPGRGSGIGHIEKPPVADKGDYQGSCNRSACLKPGAIWYNHSTRKYYCVNCAHDLNYDVFNKREALQMYGHLLCTEGRYDDTWDYRYEKPQDEIVVMPEDDPHISGAGSLTILRPSIEQKYFDDFMKIYNDGKRYEHCRLGQAFYLHFHLGKMVSRPEIRGLFEKDGDEAKAAINSLFEFH